ncbi:MAG: flagellar biosynthesis anti-sigma factor FlgM [Aeromonadaceae bacterium]|nr:flagellar biosynthesis anti-sigma factor FlgM [Aeromonadaceae bacterium]MBP8772670.1 flagellar biosynthesis anti-sigma factor FlgM [Aeromonadaceae bacterium]
MAINNVNNLLNRTANQVGTSATNAGTTAQALESSTQGKVVARQDAVVLTDQAQGLNKLQQRIKDSPSTNQGKIEALKSAIERGTYTVDSQRVAQKMMDMESDLDTLNS